ncbi:MAG: LLM class flavin-dependent oxidoreductase [Actinomycetota bacterium]|jgi:phthiodiolone/phenolphthiodiolone dimycocerosates ketoreductase|nr:LLM class flavin-dependent oxidoreductase [Actinomycetota bacterium]
MDVGVAMGAVPPFGAMRRRVERFAQAGLSSCWWPDHLVAFHSHALWATGALADIQPDPHAYADPFVCMAACASSAGDALVGVCVTDAVRRMPATLAQTVMSLDHLAPGRVVLGLGAGEHANYAPYGWEVDSPARRLDEAATQIRRLLDDGSADEHGAVLGLRPPTGSRGPQLWIAAHGPKGYDVAGRCADGWIPNFLPRDAWMAGRRAVAESARQSGRDPSAITYALSAQVVVADSHEAAHELLEHPVLRAYGLLLPPDRFAEVGAVHPLGGRGLSHLVASRDDGDQLAAAKAVPFPVVHDYFVHGTPAEVAAHIGAYDGLDHAVLWDPVPLVDLAAARTSAAGVTEVAHILQGTSSSAS